MIFLLVPPLPQSKLKTTGIFGPLFSTRSRLQRKVERMAWEAEVLRDDTGTLRGSHVVCFALFALSFVI